MIEQSCSLADEIYGLYECGTCEKCHSSPPFSPVVNSSAPCDQTVVFGKEMARRVTSPRAGKRAPVYEAESQKHCVT